jgi:hypothetical protein
MRAVRRAQHRAAVKDAARRLQRWPSGAILDRGTAAVTGQRHVGTKAPSWNKALTKKRAADAARVELGVRRGASD